MTINDIQKHNKIYDENPKLNEMFFKDDVNHIVQSTQFQLQFITSFLIVKKYSQEARTELFKENVSRAKNNIHHFQNQFINYSFFINVIDYSLTKSLMNYKMSKNDVDTFFHNLNLQ